VGLKFCRNPSGNRGSDRVLDAARSTRRDRLTTQPNPPLPTALDAVRILVIPANCQRSYSSTTPVSDDSFSSFNNDRHFPRPTGVLEHLLQLLGVFLDVKIDGFVAIG
jgi:hypothetical protein